jgi:predicted nucleic acid-binding protein
MFSAGNGCRPPLVTHCSSTPVPTNDVWIAASSARAGSLVLTYDRHFEKMLRVGSVILS